MDCEIGALAFLTAFPLGRLALVRRVRPTRSAFIISLVLLSSLSLFHAGWTACVLPPIIYSENRRHLRSLQYEGTPLTGERETNGTDEYCCIYCMLGFFTGASWILQVRPGRADEIFSQIF
jgi:hypothetical protein